MVIKTEKINDVLSRITIIVQKEDIKSEIEKSFKRIQKNTMMNGFRKGYVPKSILCSVYGKSILLEELNKLVSSKLGEYIKKNNLAIFGEPLLNKQTLDIENSKTYEFVFDVGLQPNIIINLNKEYVFSYYTVEITNKMIDDHIDFLKNQYGHQSSNIDCIEKKDKVIGNLTKLDSKNFYLNEVSLIPLYIKDDKEQDKFIGKRKGDTIIFNPYKAFGGVEAELSYFLQINRSEIKDCRGDFSFTISEIIRYRQAEINQELFDKVYGEGTIISEIAFKEKVKKELLLQWEMESDYKFLLDVERFLFEKIQHLQFPEDFLKHLWKKNHPETTLKDIEKNFLNIINNVKIQYIWSKVIEENRITVNTEELKQMAKNFVGDRDDTLFKSDEFISQLQKKILEIKIIQCLKEKTTLISKIITKEDFRKLQNNRITFNK